MARVWSTGFELGSSTALVEWDTTTGSPSVVTNIVRSGTYALRCNPTSATSFIAHQTHASSTVLHAFLRVYLNIQTLPNVDTTILSWNNTNSASGPYEGIQLKTDGTLQFRNSAAASGSVSSALSSNTWHRIEYDFVDNPGGASTGVLKGYVDGVLFTTVTGLNMNGGMWVTVGPIVATTCDLYFDDFAFNDNSGSFQNNLPGEGKIIHLHPDSAGDNAGFVQGAGGTNNWDRVSEVTPDDLTTYNNRTSGTPIDDHNLGPSGLDASAQINVVAVGNRVGSDSTTSTGRTLVTRLKSQANGTVTSGSSVAVNVNGFTTHGAAVPKLYKVTSYTDPQAGGQWNNVLLDNAQIGYQADTSSTNSVRVSTSWLLVDFTPGVYSIPSKETHPGKGPSNIGRFAQTYADRTPAATAVTQNITPIGISSNEQLGNSNSVSVVASVGASTNEAVGNITLLSTAIVSSIGLQTQEAFGAPVLSLNVTNQSILTNEKFGNVSVGQSVTLVGASTDERIGNANVVQVITPTGVAPNERFGSDVVTLNVAPTGIITNETLGNFAVANVVTISPQGVEPAERFGLAVVSPGSVAITPGSVGSEERFGSPQVSPGAVSTAPVGIGTQEIFGTSSISNVVTIAPYGILTNEKFGNSRTDLNIAPIGIPTEEKLGTVIGALSITPAGLLTQEQFGSGQTSNVVSVVPFGIPSTEQSGSLAISLTLPQVGVVTGETFGTTIVVSGSVTVSPRGIVSTEAFGSISQTQDLLITPKGIGSSEQSGNLSISQTLGLTGSQSVEVFGRAVISTGPVSVTITSVKSEEIFGSGFRITLGQDIKPQGFSVVERFGSFNIFRAPDVESSVNPIPTNVDYSIPVKQSDTSIKITATDTAPAQVKSSFAVPVV